MLILAQHHRATSMGVDRPYFEGGFFFSFLDVHFLGRHTNLLFTYTEETPAASQLHVSPCQAFLLPQN